MDKREAVRVPVRLKARCHCHGLVIDGTVEDVSRSGLFMRAPKWIRPGSCAELDVDLPGETQPLRFKAEVVRIEHGSAREGIGFRFQQRAETNRPLANFIMRQHQAIQ
ncbi:MAG: PilZ domain-containing protein [Kofleriaceae bacterium]